LRILAVNAGSSSLKVRVLDEEDAVLAATDAPVADAPGLLAALSRFIADCGPVDAVGHRVVHGGVHLRAPTVVDADVRERLAALVPLAPLHQPAALAGLDAARQLLPGVPNVACFDTAFHATIPETAATYPLPLEWREAYGLRRFGFHGLSLAYASGRAAELLGFVPGRLVTCHLGAGSSITAVVEGRSVDTTMGFTPNEGVPMATRSGSVDVGMLGWLLERGLTPAQLAEGLGRTGGLLGLAGTGDMREIESAATAGDPRAALGLDVWAHRVAQAVAAMASSAGGIDAITFTGGIGEHSSSLRLRLGRLLGWLGLELDPTANARSGDDHLISTPRSAVAALVVAAREDVQIAREVRAVLAR
jgi:acetate kinase